MKRTDGKGKVVIEKQNGKWARCGENGGKRSRATEGTGRAENLTLGAEGVIPGRYIVSLLRVFKQFTHTLPSR